MLDKVDDSNLSTCGWSVTSIRNRSQNDQKFGPLSNHGCNTPSTPFRVHPLVEDRHLHLLHKLSVATGLCYTHQDLI